MYGNSFGTMMMPPGAGNDQMSRLMQFAMMARQNPEGLAKIMAGTGQAPPPVQVSQLPDISPRTSQTGLGERPAPTPAPIANVQPPVVSPGAIQAAAGPSPGPINAAPGIGAKIMQGLQGMTGVMAPQQPQQIRPEMAPATPLNRTGAQMDPAILGALVQMMAGAQGTRPAASPLGALISGR